MKILIKGKQEWYINIKANKIIRDREDYILTTVTLLRTSNSKCVWPNNIAKKYEDVSTPLSKNYRTRQKISKNIEFNTTINQNDLIDI